MEPLFRVTTTYNRKTLLESYRNTIKIFGIVMLCVSCAAMLYLAHYFAQYISAYFHNSRVGVLFLAVMTPLILAFYLTTPNRFVRRELKKYRNQFGTKACMIDSVFYTDYFQSKNLNSGALYTIPYSNLGSLRESKNLFYLSPKATNTVYVINKGGFALGSAENFRAFIRSKLDRRKLQSCRKRRSLSKRCSAKHCSLGSPTTLTTTNSLSKSNTGARSLPQMHSAGSSSRATMARLSPCRPIFHLPSPPRGVNTVCVRPVRS